MIEYSCKKVFEMLTNKYQERYLISAVDNNFEWTSFTNHKKIVKSKIGIVQSIFYVGNVEMTDGMVLMANIMSDIFHYIS